MANERWRNGWISFDCCLHVPETNRVYCGITSFADNIWLESSRNGPGNYQLFETRGVCDRLVFGSSAPEYIQDVELQIIRECIEDIAILEKIFFRNFEKIFNTGGAA